jgi:2-oxoisovalerate dehydrogenase E1 component beta subunit
MVQAIERPTEIDTAGAEAPATVTFLEAINRTLRDAMRADDRVVVLGEDVGVRGGVFRATAGLLDAFGEGRVIDTPLAESGIIGTAIGMAVNGLRPVAEIQFMDFIHPAMDQIMNEAAKFRYRSNNDFSVPMVIRVPFGGGVHGALYHSQSLEAIFVHTPGLKVVAPSTPADAAGLLRTAIADEDPVMFLEHKKMYRAIKGELPAGPETIPLGRARVIREGTDVTVIAYAMMVHEARKAVEAVERETGASVELIDLRSLKPLDETTIVESVKKTGKALVISEANGPCSVASEVAALIGERAFAWLDGPVTRLTAPDVPAMPFSPPLEHAFLIDAAKIETALTELVRF